MFKTSHNKKEKGQGLVEYALILVLVAIVVIAVLMLLGPIIGNVFSTINGSLSSFSGGGGVAADPYAAYADDIMASGTWNAQDAINQWCYGKPSGTPYKHYYWGIGSNLLGGANTSAPSNYYLYGTGSCP